MLIIQFYFLNDSFKKNCLKTAKNRGIDDHLDPLFCPCSTLSLNFILGLLFVFMAVGIFNTSKSVLNQSLVSNACEIYGLEWSCALCTFSSVPWLILGRGEDVLSESPLRRWHHHRNRQHHRYGNNAGQKELGPDEYRMSGAFLTWSVHVLKKARLSRFLKVFQNIFKNVLLVAQKMLKNSSVRWSVFFIGY